MSVATQVAAPVRDSHRGGPTDPSHDAELRRGILHTRISRSVAWALVVPFLVVLARGARSLKWFTTGGRATSRCCATSSGTRPRATTCANSRTSSTSRPPRASTSARACRSSSRGSAHYGNRKATIGFDGWLYYTPGITAVAGRPFLDPDVLAARRVAGEGGDASAVSPDPRPAILAFANYLRGRGVRLVLFPVPDKASLQPVQLHGRARDVSGVPPAQNPDRPRLAAELESAGVLVFDPTPAALHPGEPPYFMRQDTHWTPQWMEKVAGDLAAFLLDQGLLPRDPGAAGARVWRAVAKSVSRVGDVTDMLGLPEGQALFSPETYTIHEIQDPGGAPFEPSDHGAVLLLGDSFTNVFSAEQMGWGASAGLGAAAGARAGPRRRRYRAERRRCARDPAPSVQHAGGRRGSPGGQDRRRVGVGLARARDRRFQTRRLGGAARAREEEPVSDGRLVLVTGAAGEVGRRLVGPPGARRVARASAGPAGRSAAGAPGRNGRRDRGGRRPGARDAGRRDGRRRLGRPPGRGDPGARSARLRRDQPAGDREPGRRRSRRRRPALRLRVVGLRGLSAADALRARQAGRRKHRGRREAPGPHHRSPDAGLRRDRRAGVHAVSQVPPAFPGGAVRGARARPKSVPSIPTTWSTAWRASWATRPASARRTT